MKKAVILTVARSGSNLLLSLLNSHPELFFHGEVYKPDYVATFRASTILKDLIGVDPTELRNQDPIRFFKTIFALSPTHYQAVGFKLFFNHSAPVLELIARDKDVSVILLERENRLATFSSQLIGERTGVWRKANDNSEAPLQDNKEPPKLPFDAEAFADFCRRIDRRYSDFREKVVDPSRVHEVKYSDLLQQETWRGMLDFLGADTGIPLSPGMVKQNVASPIERFANKDAVITYLEKVGRQVWSEEVLK